MAPTIGIVLPCITCFDETGAVDYPRTRAQVDWLIEAGVHNLLGIGTCGEFFGLETGERRQLAEKLVEWVGGRIPLYIGVMHTSTRIAVDLAKHAEAVGATGVMSVPPYYGVPPEREVLTYFRDLAKAVSIPLIVYNNPWASGVPLSVNLLATLAREGTVRIIKESHGDPTRIHDLRLLVPPETSLVYGEDYGSFEAIVAGADGWVAGVGNFMPRQALKLWELARGKDVGEARRHWFRILPLVNMTSKKPMFGRPDERPDFIQIYKAALDHMGRCGGPCRRPLLSLPQEDLDYLHRLMDELQLSADTA